MLVFGLICIFIMFYINQYAAQAGREMYKAHGMIATLVFLYSMYITYGLIVVFLARQLFPHKL